MTISDLIQPELTLKALRQGKHMKTITATTTKITHLGLRICHLLLACYWFSFFVNLDQQIGFSASVEMK